MTNTNTKTSREAFEEWYTGRFGCSPVADNGQYMEHAHWCVESWQAALAWIEEGDRG